MSVCMCLVFNLRKKLGPRLRLAVYWGTRVNKCLQIFTNLLHDYDYLMNDDEYSPVWQWNTREWVTLLHNLHKEKNNPYNQANWRNSWNFFRTLLTLLFLFEIAADFYPPWRRWYYLVPHQKLSPATPGQIFQFSPITWQ